MKNKGVGITVGLLAIFVVLTVGTVLVMNQIGAVGGGAGEIQGTPEVPLVTTSKCQDDGTNAVFALAKNPVNVTLHYNAASFAAVGTDGTLVVAGTGTAGATATFTNLAIPCDENNYAGDLYALLTTGYNSAKASYNTIENGATTDTVTVSVVPTGALAIAAYDVTLTNTTQGNSADDTEAGCTETEVDTNAISDINAGGSFTRFIDFKQATAYKSYGSDLEGQPGILVGIDNNNQSSWGASDIKLSSSDGGGNLKLVSCSEYLNVQSVGELDYCYTMDAISSADPTRRLKIEGTANRGNPHADIQVIFYDLGYAQDVSGEIIFDGANSGGTSLGQTTDCSMTVNLF